MCFKKIVKRAGFEGNQHRVNLTKVCLKADGWSTGNMRWLEMSEQSSVNLQYSVNLQGPTPV